MNIRNALAIAGLAAAIAIPATSTAQFYSPYRSNYGRPSYYGYGPYGPSYIPGPSYQYYGNSRPLRTGGATVYFGPGGGYYGGYGYGYNSYPRRSGYSHFNNGSSYRRSHRR